MDDDTLLTRTDDEIRKDVITIATQETGIRNYKSVGVLRGLLETFARVVSGIYKAYLRPIYARTNLDTATDRWLSQWGLLMGVVRKAATKTVGMVTVTGYDDGQLDAGTWITVSGTDLRYRVLSDRKFVAGTFTVEVEAEFTGSGYNVTDDVGHLSKVVSGIEAVSFGDDWITSPGTDDEDDDAYRRRIKDRWLSQGVGNPPASFVYYATSVPGVREVKLIRTPRGYGTVDIIVVAANGLPTQDLLDAVYKAIGDHRLICNDLQVKAPNVTDVAITVEYRGDRTANMVQESILQHVYALGIGGVLEVRALYALLADLDKVEVLAPVRDIAAAEDSIIVAKVHARRMDA